MAPLSYRKADVRAIFASAGIDPDTYPASFSALMNHVYDGQYTSPLEAQTAFNELGYTPTEEDWSAFIGNSYGDDALDAAIYGYVDPRQITEEEVEAFALANGINLTPEQIAELTQQSPDPLDITTIFGEYDSDGDGVPNALDFDVNNPDITTEPVDPNTIDTDGDGVPDVDDFDPNDPDITTEPVDPNTIDTDGDGVPDVDDFDPNDPDITTEPVDPNTIDTDGDGVPDVDDFDPNDPDITTEPESEPVDTDGDGIPDEFDADPDVDNTTDTDGDGVPDYLDEYPDDPDNVEPDLPDRDGDGIPDEFDSDPDVDNTTDTDGDGTPDYLDEYPNDPENMELQMRLIVMVTVYLMSLIQTLM